MGRAERSTRVGGLSKPRSLSVDAPMNEQILLRGHWTRCCGVMPIGSHSSLRSHGRPAWFLNVAVFTRDRHPSLRPSFGCALQVPSASVASPYVVYPEAPMSGYWFRPRQAAMLALGPRDCECLFLGPGAHSAAPVDSDNACVAGKHRSSFSAILWLVMSCMRSTISTKMQIATKLITCPVTNIPIKDHTDGGVVTNVFCNITAIMPPANSDNNKRRPLRSIVNYYSGTCGCACGDSECCWYVALERSRQM